ncbi:MAG TPA: FAD-binding protein [Chthonomonadales bacterium]|nr:FAD-binding protein [Chthonomonadales bacterium]
MSGLLVLAESDGAAVQPATKTALAFAQQLASILGCSFDLLIAGGEEIEGAAADWRNSGARRILLASHHALKHPTADRIAYVCTHCMATYDLSSLAGAATSFGRDILPRAAGLLDLPMVSDVVGISAGASGPEFVRPAFAGNVITTVRLLAPSAVYSARTTAFADPAQSGHEGEILRVELHWESIGSGTEWIGLEAGEQKRPDLTSARVVVSGGRPLRDAETFERILGGLADKLGGAVGATRAAVDSGIAPNELQVGQTGKVVAPDLYIAAGVSGSVQHLAGMKDSKVIVAINTDPEAPIFEVADFGLVADLFQAVPELTAKV